MMKIRIAVLLLAISSSCAAFSQSLDFSITIHSASEPVPGGLVVYALVVDSNPRTNTNEAFTARLTVPPQLEVVSVCEAGTFDAATRALTWEGRLDNPWGGQSSCAMTFRVSPSLWPGATFTLAASLTTPTADPNPANNAATSVGVVRADSDLGVTSSVDIRRFRPGATVTYTFTLANLGPQDAHDVKLVDQISSFVSFVSFQAVSGPPAVVDAAPRNSGPGSCFPPRCGDYVEASIPLLPNRATATFQLVVQAKTSFETADISNRVFAESTAFDSNRSNNDHNVWAYAGPQADLSLTGSAPPDATGPEIPITLTVTNSGPDTVNDVKIDNLLIDIEHRFDFGSNTKFIKATPSQGKCSDPGLQWVAGSPWPPPVGTVDCSLGSLASGATATITVLMEHKPGSGPFTVASQVTPAQNDQNVANNISEVSVGLGRRRAKR